MSATIDTVTKAISTTMEDLYVLTRNGDSAVVSRSAVIKLFEGSAADCQSWIYARSADAALAAMPGGGWLPIGSAPKDGTPIFVLGNDNPKRCHIAHWEPEGTSWVDEMGSLEGDAYELAVTGIWACGTGWFQPNEVAFWQPLPAAPTSPAAAEETK